MHAHAGTAGVSRVHTRPSCSWCYVRSSHTHRRTQKRHGGACRPHKCACVRDEFIPLCLAHVHAYVNTRFALTHARKHARQTHFAPRQSGLASVWVHQWSRFVLTKYKKHKNGGNFVPLAERSENSEKWIVYSRPTKIRNRKFSFYGYLGTSYILDRRTYGQKYTEVLIVVYTSRYYYACSVALVIAREHPDVDKSWDIFLGALALHTNHPRINRYLLPNRGPTSYLQPLCYRSNRMLKLNSIVLREKKERKKGNARKTN